MKCQGQDRKCFLKTNSYNIGSFKRDFDEHQLPGSYKHGKGFRQSVLPMYIDSTPHFHGWEGEMFIINIVVGELIINNNNNTTIW